MIPNVLLVLDSLAAGLVNDAKGAVNKTLSVDAVSKIIEGNSKTNNILFVI